ADWLRRARVLLFRLLVCGPFRIVGLSPVEHIAQHPPHTHAAEADIAGPALGIVSLRDLHAAKLAHDQLVPWAGKLPDHAKARMITAASRNRVDGGNSAGNRILN